MKNIAVDKLKTILIIILIVGIPFLYILEWLEIIPYSLAGDMSPIEGFLVVIASLSCSLFVISCIRKKIDFLPVLLAGLYLISGVFSTLLSSDVGISLRGNSFSREGLIHLFCYLIVMLEVTTLGEVRYRRYIVHALYTLGLFEVILGLVQVHSILEVFAYEGDRAAGTFFNPNTYGSFMVLVYGLSLGEFVMSEFWKKKLVAGFFSVVFFYGVLLSGTRGALVGVAGSWLCMACILFFIKRHYIRKKALLKNLGTSLLMLCAAFLLAACTTHVLPDIAERVSADLQSDSPSSLGSGRLPIWVSAVEQFLDNPIFGVGLANFTHVTSGFEVVDGSLIYTTNTAYVVHNQYLEALVTQGAFGLVVYMLLICGCIVHSWRAINIREKESSEVSISGMMAVVGFLSADVFGWHIVYLTPYFYIILGLMCSGEQDRKKVVAEIECDEYV